MKNRNKAPVQVHIKNGDVTVSEDPRHVTRAESIEFIAVDFDIYQVLINDAPSKPVFVAPHINGSWPAHGKVGDAFTYSIKSLLPKNRRRDKSRKVHTIIIDAGLVSKTRKPVPSKKKPAKKAHTIIIHSG